MRPQFPSASSSPSHMEQSSPQPPSPTLRPGGSSSAISRAAPAGPSFASLPPRSAVVLPILPQRQPFRIEPRLPVVSASENVADLTMLRAQISRLQGENKLAYARRLHFERPQLTRSEISQLSGITESNLRQEPAFQALLPHLDQIREQPPRREGEKNPAYAHRLRRERPQLTLPEISQLSGVTKHHLRQYPAFRALLPHLDLIREQLPQLEGENNPAYAHRLHQERPLLTLPEISLLSGVSEHHLNQDPAFRPLLPLLAPSVNSYHNARARRNKPTRASCIRSARCSPCLRSPGCPASR
jgi:hypothetical protein